jgi:hypothetical protein
MSLTVEIRSADGSSSATATSGEVLTLDIVGVVTAGTANAADGDRDLSTSDPSTFGINDVTGSIISTGIYSGDVAGNMTAAVESPAFSANSYQNGTPQDLNGDGNIDVGSNDPANVQGYWFARHGGIYTNGTVSGNSMVILLGTVTYTVTNLNHGGETDINFVPRPSGAPGTYYSGEWYDGVQYDYDPSIEQGAYASDHTSTIQGGTPFIITDTPLNPAPVVNTDAVSTLRNTPLTINALGNVTTSDALVASSVAIGTQPADGTAVVQSNGSIIYTPNTGFAGSDSFTYRVADSNGKVSSYGPVNITVTAPPPPVAVADTATTLRNQAVTINVLANDTDASGTITPSTVAIASNPADGTVSVQSDGTIIYTPTAGFIGSDSFTYTVGDSLGDTSSPGTVTVSVTLPVPPVANNDTETDLEGHPATLSVLSNDTMESVAIDPTTVVIGTSPADGTAVPQADGTVIYTSNSGFIGTDTFTYTVKDILGDVSNTATVTVNVTAITPPTAVDDTATDTEGLPSTISVLSNDVAASVALDPTKVLIGTGPTNGTAVAQSDGTVIYTSKPGFVGSDSFTYTVDDIYGDPSNVATVNVTVAAAAPPVASSVNNPITGTAGTPINVLANVTSTVPLVPSSVTVNTPPTGGTASVNASTGAITYTPNANFVGTDTFTYTVADINGNVSAPATVTVNVGSTLSSAKGGNRSITFVDATGGTETVTLNVGTASVLFSGTGTATTAKNGKVTITNGSNLEIYSIDLSGTTKASSLVVTGKANKAVTIGNVTDTSPLGSFTARSATLVGSTTLLGAAAGTFNVGGIGSLTVAGISDVAITLGSGGAKTTSLSLGVVSGATTLTSSVPISSLKTTSWTASAEQPATTSIEETITAPSIGSIVSTGNFGVSVTVSPTGKTAGIASARIGGAVAGNWNDSGNSGAITAASAASNWAPSITGALTSLTIKSGGLADPLTAGSIGTLAITGDLTGNITAASAKLIRLTGSVSGATLDFTGAAGLTQLTASSLVNSVITADVAAGTALTTATAAQLGSGTIGSIVLNGRTGNQFSGSTILADKIRTLSLGSVNTDNNGTTEGIAATSITAVSGIFGSSSIHLGHGQLATEAVLQSYLSQQSITFGDFAIEIV